MTKILFSGAIFFSLLSCSQPGDKPQQEGTKPADVHTMDTKSEKKDFSHIQFAINKDTICGMPLSAGISDTAQVDGKIYGFCSPECKETFLAEAGHKH